MKRNFNKKWFNSNNGEFYDCQHTLDYVDENGHTVDIAIVYSGRNRRKSFNVSATMIKKAYEQNKKFGYIRRYDKELTSESIERYFYDKSCCVDSNGNFVGNYCEELTDNKANIITYYRKHFYLTKREDNNGNIEDTRILDIGSVFSMSLANQYRSLQYPDYIGAIFEEFLTADNYVVDEPNKLLNLVSTIKRSRKDFTLFMLANTISKINPYVEDWGLTKFRSQKPGTIDFYRLPKENGDYFLISCEYLKDREDSKNDSKLKMSTVVDSNRFDEPCQYNAINKNWFTEHFEIDTKKAVVFEGKSFKYIAYFVNIPTNTLNVYKEIEPDFVNNKMQYLYIEPKTSKILDKTRLYTDNAGHLTNKYSTMGFKKIYEIDNIIETMIKSGWMIFSNNLVGNEFMQTYNYLRLK